MRRLYALFMYLATPCVFAYFALRGTRDSRYWRRWGERLGRVPAGLGAGRIMVHGSSLGEVNAAGPLVQALLELTDSPGVLFTSFTPTGSQRVLALFGGRTEHCYLPLDVPSAVRRFLDRERPLVLVIMETEIWPNLIHFAAESGIPILIANARMSEKSLRGYQRLAPLIRPALARVHRILAQSTDDGARFRAGGANPAALAVTGNLKFDIDIPASLRESGELLRAAWGPARYVLVAGSTHEGDESVLLPAFAEVLNSFPDALLVLAPRHPERFADAARSARLAGLNTHLASAGVPLPPGTQCLVLDAMGELLRHYAAADVAFVGGTLARVGGHNVLEPAALGRPILVGPHCRHIEETVRRSEEAGGVRRVTDARTLTVSLSELFGDAAERDRMGQANLLLVREGRGALERTIAEVQRLAEGPN